ncbi:MAG: hypothetical protein WBA93_17805 [Microcoleaceae cyanobacterium]
MNNISLDELEQKIDAEKKVIDIYFNPTTTYEAKSKGTLKMVRFVCAYQDQMDELSIHLVREYKFRDSRKGDRFLAKTGKTGEGRDWE